MDGALQAQTAAAVCLLELVPEEHQRLAFCHGAAVREIERIRG